MSRQHLNLLCILIVLAKTAPSFGQLNYLQPTVFERLPAWASELSSSGHYIAGLTVLNDQQEILDEAQRNGRLPDVSYRVGLLEIDGNQVEQLAEVTFDAPLLTDAFAIFDLAISPDETLLAIREDGLVRLLRVPTLETEQLIEAPSEQSLFYDELAWSMDSRYLAFNNDELALSVWDRQTGQVSTSTNNGELAGPITALPDGWIVRQPIATEGGERLFRACDLLVEQCRVYTLNDLGTTIPYESVSASPNGEGVFILLEDDSAWWWAREDSGEFAVSAEPVLSELRGTIPDRPPYFSSDSRYLAIPNFYDVTKTDIYDVGSWEHLSPSLPTRLSSFIPQTNAVAWWESSKEALGITCIGQSETAAVIKTDDVWFVTTPFEVSVNGEYLLILNDDSSLPDGVFRVLIRLPEVEC
jgi:hypothetical protein